MSHRTRDYTDSPLNRDIPLVLNLSDPEDKAALEDAILTTADATEADVEGLNDALYRLACLGFYTDGLCQLLYPLAVFAEDVSEPVERMAQDAGQQINAFGIPLEDVEAHLLEPIRYVTIQHPTTAREVFNALAYCAPVVAPLNGTPTGTVYKIGLLAKTDGKTGAQAGEHIRRAITHEIRRQGTQ